MPKTLMPYPSLSYCLSFILQLIKYFYSLTFDFCILCELQVEREFRKHFGAEGRST